MKPCPYNKPVSLLKIPTDKTPHMPPEQWTAKALSGSSTFNFNSSFYNNIYKFPHIMPIIRAAQGSILLQDAVMLTSPAITPLQSWGIEYK